MEICPLVFDLSGYWVPFCGLVWPDLVRNFFGLGMLVINLFLFLWSSDKHLKWIVKSI
jgi:hypothetical protein